MKKKIWLMALLVVGMVFFFSLPLMAAENDDSSITVYFTLSDDGQLVQGNDADSTILAHVPVTVDYFDLADYGLADFYRYETDSYENGGGDVGYSVIERPTLLHLFIKVLEEYYLGGGTLTVGGDALTITGSPASMYMTSFWGHNENLMYYVDHAYPQQKSGCGSTADYILLEDGMEIDVAMFSDWGFYSRGAFAFFDQTTDTVDVNEDVTLQMLATSTSGGNGDSEAYTTFSDYPMAGEDVLISKDKGITWQTAADKTDKDGKITLSFDEPGTYYISSDNVYVNFPCRYENGTVIPLGDDGKPCVAPPIAVITVEESDGNTPLTEADVAGYFYLVAETQEKLVIPPEKVYYAETDTVKDALSKTEHEFIDLDTAIGLNTIDGVYGFYTVYDQNGDFPLNALASTVKTLRISEDQRAMSSSLAALINAMGRYNASPELQNYSVAKDTYEQALSVYLNVGDDEAASLAEELNQAIDDYENQDEGDKYGVTFNVTQNQASVNHAHIVVTNRFGTAYSTYNGTLQLVAGKYDFSVTSQQNGITGTITVNDENLTVDLEMPDDNWLEDMNFSKTSGVDDYYDKIQVNGYKYDFFVPDTMSNLFIYMKRSSAAPYDSNRNPQSWYLDYLDKDENEKSGSDFNWTNTVKSVTDLLDTDGVSRLLTCAIRYTEASTGYVYSQYYTANFKRVPTLTSISVSDGSALLAADQRFDPLTEAYTYKVLPTTSEVTVSANAFGTADEGYSVTVDGTTLAAGESRTVALTGDQTEIPVEVEIADGESRTYQLTVDRNTTSSDVTFNAEDGVSVEVQNAEGHTISPQESGGYQLIEGETYTYIATKDDYYHTSADFEASAGLTIPVSVDSSKDWLSVLSFRNNENSTSGDAFTLDQSFDPATHTYRMTVPDWDNAIYAWATASAEAEGSTITASYTQLSSVRTTQGTDNTVKITSGDISGQRLLNLVAHGGYGNKMTICVTKTKGDITYYQDYILEITRLLSLDSLSVLNGSRILTMHQADSNKTGFDQLVSDYTVDVPETAETLSLNYVGNFNAILSGDNDDGYSMTVNGDPVTLASGESGSADITLNGNSIPETVAIVISHTDENTPDRTYTIQINKKPPVAITFNCEPEGTILMVTEKVSDVREWPDDNGAFQLMEGYTYTYTASKSGYVTKQDSFTVTTAQTISVALDEAEPNEDIDSDIPSEWPSFRGNADNNGVTDSPMPTEAEDTVLSWATKLGSGSSSSAVGSPIIVDGYLYTYSGSKIYKIDTISGEVVATGQMDHNSNFSITPPAYAQGMIFVGLSEGTIQAFNADTLDSLWVYEDPLGGQPNSPIVYHDGYIYTGFWTGEIYDANYVCVSITDEDIHDEEEAKAATWTYTQKGGFYWTGSYVCDDYLLVGTDDGCNDSSSDTAHLLSLDPNSGALIDQIDGIAGDMRSSVAYDKETNRFYFTSKGGYFYSVAVAENGTFDDAATKSIHLSNSSGGMPMSTSTPTVYNGRAYIGVCGRGQFDAYSGHNITVIDLTSWSIAYTVPTQGYPQTSGLLTTAYEKDGYVYVYFFDNYTPGKLRMIKDKPGTVSPLLTDTESYKDDKGVTRSLDAGYVLFTPAYEQAQYAICSPITDKYGVIYFKNDSANLMALGPTIEKLEVTKEPDKVSYKAGETFDPTGMAVTITYSNGMTRDVTDYVSYTTSPLTENDQEIYITFDYVMYQNNDGKVGVEYETPFDFIDITVTDSSSGTAQDVIDQINDLPAVGDLTLTDRNLVEAAREAYDALTAAKKVLVTNLSTLEAAEAKMASLKAAAPSASDMSDVKSGAWFYGDVDYVLSYGIFTGTSATTFGPDEYLTRGQFVTTIGRLEGVKSLAEGGSGKTNFSDVNATSYYAPYVKWAAENGIVNGTGSGKFSPDAKITREQMATIIVRYAEKMGITLTDGSQEERFADDGNISSWAKEAVYDMKASGIINGVGGNKFEPQGSATRAQAAKILHLLNELR